jgi:two-component system, OmpR family, response regulator MprA
LLRRSGAGAGLLRFAGIELDVAAHPVSRRGMRLPLTKTEFALLELFLRNPGRVLSRTQIFESVWGTTSARKRTGCGSISAICGGRWASRG